MRRKSAAHVPNDYELEAKLGALERSHTERTRLRREVRWRRQRSVLLVIAVFAVLFVLAAPSIVSHSPLAHSFLEQAGADAGWQIEAESVQMGWITPLRLTGVRLRGETAGTTIAVHECQTTVTLRDLWSGRPQEGRFGQVTLRGVEVAAEVDDQWSSIEADLAKLLSDETDEPSIAWAGAVTVQDLLVQMTDRPSGQTWTVSQSHGGVQWTAGETTSDFAGVLTQPGGGDGSIQGSWRCGNSDVDTAQSIDVQADSLPLSILALVQRRFPDSELPAQLTGDASGNMSVRIDPAGFPAVTLDQVQLRNLAAVHPQTRQRLWHNDLATLRGDLTWREGRVIARRLSAGTDFGELSMDGSFQDTLTIAGASTNPLSWLDQVDASAYVRLDLAQFQQAFPDALPLRPGTRLRNGRVELRIEPINETATRGGTPMRRRRLVVHSDVIEADTGGSSPSEQTSVRIAPIDLLAVVASDRARLVAEQFRLDSPFGSVEGQGELQRGAARWKLDFDKLSRQIRPLIRESAFEMEGAVAGQLQWDASLASGRPLPDGRTLGPWRLRGDAEASRLVLRLGDHPPLRQASLKVDVDVSGQLASAPFGSGQRPSLEELSSGQLTANGDGVRAEVVLAEAVDRLDATTELPLRVRCQGQLRSLIDILGPWVPASMRSTRGGFEVAARVDMTGDQRLQLNALDGQLTGLGLVIDQKRYTQELVKLHFDGRADWPTGDVVIRSLSVAGDAASAAAQGEWIGGVADVEVAWKAKLDRLQASGRPQMAETDAGRKLSANGPWRGDSVRPVNFTATDEPVDPQWKWEGDLEGRCVLTGDRATLLVETHATGEGVGWKERVNQTDLRSYQAVFGSDPRDMRSRSGNRSAPGETTRWVWFEPKLDIDGTIRCNLTQSRYQAEPIRLSSEWGATTLTGEAVWTQSLTNVRLKGRSRLNMAKVARRLSDLSGTPIVAEGQHDSPIEIQYARGVNDTSAFTIISSIGWETVDTAGMLFGPAEVPLRMTESVVTVQPSVVPVLGPSRLTPRMIGPMVAPLGYGDASTASGPSAGPNGRDRGEIRLAGKVHYRPAVWIELEPGEIARHVRVTPDMTDQWLKYLAPIAADAARIEGTFSAELQEAVVSIDDPRQTRMQGRLDIQEVRMNAGPLADQMIASARQLQALAAIGRPVQPPRSGRTLVTLPAQMVEFQVSDGVVRHRALRMEVDRAQVVTSGEVALDGRLNLTAQVPLDAAWLGADLRGLAGQKLTLPIDGTLSRPSLDSAGVRRVVADLGTRAAEEAAGNFLQQQLGRGQQQLEDSLNKGIERLGIEKLFGR